MFGLPTTVSRKTGFSSGKVKIVNPFEPFNGLLPSGYIVIMKQRDLDERAAREIIQSKVKAIINCETTMSGTYPVIGPLLLMQHDIPIWEASPDCFTVFKDHDTIRIDTDMFLTGGRTYPLRRFTKEDWLLKHNEGQVYMNSFLERLIQDTLSDAMNHKELVIDALPPLVLNVDLTGRHVLIVSGGDGLQRDLDMLKPYILSFSPVMIGVDEGANLLLENGYVPDIIIADHRCHLSDHALTCGAERVVHVSSLEANSGLEVQGLRLRDAHFVSSAGTSEDYALLLAYEQQAEYIVTAGVSSVMDRLQQGKKGIGSSLLVRMRMGHKLADAAGVSSLLRRKTSWWKESAMTLCLSGAFIAISFLQLRWGMKHVVKVVWGTFYP